MKQEKQLKKIRKFEDRLLFDKLMEEMFIDLMKDIKSHTTKSFMYKCDCCFYTLDSHYCFEYISEKENLIISGYLPHIFTKIFGIKYERAESFIKRMIIKHYQLEVK